jgi:hypothetical protein
VAKRWCTLAELDAFTRQRVIDANEWLDAFEEADEDARRKAEAEAKRVPR